MGNTGCAVAPKPHALVGASQTAHFLAEGSFTVSQPSHSGPCCCFFSVCSVLPRPAAPPRGVPRPRPDDESTVAASGSARALSTKDDMEKVSTVGGGGGGGSEANACILCSRASFCFNISRSSDMRLLSSKSSSAASSSVVSSRPLRPPRQLP